MATVFETLYTGDGIVTDFDLDFSYISRSHVFVSIDGTLDSTFTWVDDDTVQPTTTPADGAAVRIFRSTPITTQYDAFRADSVVNQTQMENADDQILFGIQETLGVAAAGGTIDAVNLSINNVAAPVSDQDAATKLYVDTEIASALATYQTENDTTNDWKYVSRWPDITTDADKAAKFYDFLDGHDYKLVCRNWSNSAVVTPGFTQRLALLVSPDTGTSPTWDEGASDYYVRRMFFNTANGGTLSATSGGTSYLTDNRWSPSFEHSCEIVLLDPTNATTKTQIFGIAWGDQADNNGVSIGPGFARFHGRRDLAQADRAVRVRFSRDPTGSTISGTVSLYRREIQTT
jgi:hypothetical protein